MPSAARWTCRPENPLTPRAPRQRRHCGVLRDQVTVKRLVRQRGQIELHPAKPDFQPIEVKATDAFTIVGVMVGLIRNAG